MYKADCALIQMRRRIQRLLKLHNEVNQIPSVTNVHQVLAEVFARRQFHQNFSSWHERHRLTAEEYCRLERNRREQVTSLNPVLNALLTAEAVPAQRDHICQVSLPNEHPHLDKSDIREPFLVPPLLKDIESQCPKYHTKGKHEF